MDNLDAALNKAVEQAAANPAPVGQVATESTDAPTKTGEEAGTTAAPTGTETKVKDKPVWDGKLESVDTLPEDLREAAREHAKAVQRYTTKLSQEAAEARKKAEDYEKRFPQDKQAAYEKWLADQAKPKPGQAPRITQEEWEDALLDPTGEKMDAIVEKKLSWRVDQERKAMAEAAKGQEKERQDRKALEDRVLEFAQLNPDFEKLAEAGIMMPMLKDELERGGTLETAYSRAKTLVESLKGQRDVELKELAEKKKSASTVDKTNGHDETVKWVNDQDEALEASIEAAISKRPVKVKVRPKKA